MGAGQILDLLKLKNFRRYFHHDLMTAGVTLPDVWD
jgi:hypothetical protein